MSADDVDPEELRNKYNDLQKRSMSLFESHTRRYVSNIRNSLDNI